MHFFREFAMLAMAVSVSAKCNAATRLATAKQVIYAYNLPDLGASAEAFKKVPWGAPDTPGGCLTTIIADGTCPIPVATTGSGTYQFAVESRQVFSHLTGEFTDFPHNGTVLVNTNVTLGVRNNFPIPVTFNGHVYMDYNADCRIYQARAFAQIPISVLGLAFSTAGVPPLPPQDCTGVPDEGGLDEVAECKITTMSYILATRCGQYSMSWATCCILPRRNADDFSW